MGCNVLFIYHHEIDIRKNKEIHIDTIKRSQGMGARWGIKIYQW